MLEGGGRAGDDGTLAGPREQSDRLGEVVGEALQRLDRLTEPEDEHERDVGGQLDIDVVGGTQLGRQFIAGAAGATHVDHDPQRVPAGDPGPADHRLADDRHAGDPVNRLAGPHRRVDRAVKQGLTVGGQLAPGGVKRREQQRVGTGGAHQPYAA